MESTTDDGAIAKYIDKKGEGIHHLAFEVEDIESEMKRLRDLGFIILNETPKVGADNKLVCFLHPKGTNGVLIELCMERPAEHSIFNNQHSNKQPLPGRGFASPS